MAWALFPPHTYLHGAHECGVGACWKLPKPARTIGPIKGIIQSNMQHHPFNHPCQSSNQPQPANQNRPAVPPTAPLSQTCLILHAQRRPAKPLRPRLTHAWRALTFIICFQPFDRCASRIAAQVQGFEAQKRAARHRPHPKGVYAANHTAPGQKRSASKAADERPLIGPAGQTNICIDVEARHWLPESPAKSRTSDWPLQMRGSSETRVYGVYDKISVGIGFVYNI